MGGKNWHNVREPRVDLLDPIYPTPGEISKSSKQSMGCRKMGEGGEEKLRGAQPVASLGKGLTVC